MKIVTDTASLFSPAEGKELNIAVVPTCIIHGDKAYRDFEEISSEEFLELVATGAITSSSQPAIGDLIDVFEESREETLALFIGDGLSGGYQSAVGAKNSIDDNEYIKLDYNDDSFSYQLPFAINIEDTLKEEMASLLKKRK